MNDYEYGGGLRSRGQRKRDTRWRQRRVKQVKWWQVQTEAVRLMIEKRKDGKRVKTFSFIAGEGARQLARLSSARHYSSFNGSVSDSQHKSLHSKTVVCVSVLVLMAEPSVVPPSIRPSLHSPESRWTPGSCTAPASPGWLLWCVCTVCT